MSVQFGTQIVRLMVLCLTLGLSAPGVQWWSGKPTRETHLLAVVTAGVEPRLSTVPSEMIAIVNATARPLTRPSLTMEVRWRGGWLRMVRFLQEAVAPHAEQVARTLIEDPDHPTPLTRQKQLQSRGIPSQKSTKP